METIYIADKNIDELISLFNCEIVNDDDFYDIIAFRISLLDLKYLVDHINTYDIKRIRACLFAFGCTKEAGLIIINKLLEFLDLSKDELLISEAIHALNRLQINDLWESHISILYNSTCPYVQGACLRYARCTLRDQSKELLLHALRDSNYIVRWNAIDELVELNDKSILDYIADLKDDPSSEVREAVRNAFEDLGEL